MADPRCAKYSALDPFFGVVMRGIAGAVDGTHYFATIADNAIFEFRYNFPGFPSRVVGRKALMAVYAPYGESITLQKGYGLVVHYSQDPRVLISEYDVHGITVRSEKAYENRFLVVRRASKFSKPLALSAAGLTIAPDDGLVDRQQRGRTMNDGHPLDRPLSSQRRASV